jgi:DNA-binding CsgD family transcriptional regulator
MVETAPRSHEVRHLWRRHNIVVVEGPSGSGRTSTAFGAVAAQVAEGGCRGLIIQGAQGPAIDDLRLWLATRVAVARATGAAPGRSYAVVDDLHLLDDEAWALLRRLSKEHDTRWVMTVASGESPERVAELEGAGAARLRVNDVSTVATREILAEVWGHEPTPGMVDLVFQLTAGRPGWIHKWAQASAHVPAEAKLASIGERSTYQWRVFQRASEVLGEGLGVGAAARSAMERVAAGTQTPADEAYLLARGEIIETDYSPRPLVAVPLLRRLVVLNASDAQPLVTHPESAVSAARRWLEMFMADGALRRLHGVQGHSAALLRLEAQVLLGEPPARFPVSEQGLVAAKAWEPNDVQRLVAIALATGDVAALAALRGEEHVEKLLGSLDLARQGRLQEALSLVDVGGGWETEPTSSGLAPLRRALAAWYAALLDRTALAYSRMFSAPPSTFDSLEAVSPLWEAMLGELHALTCLVLGEWNKAGQRPQPFPARANTWLRHDAGAWAVVSVLMGEARGTGRLAHSVFSDSIVGLGWLTSFARKVADEAELVSVGSLSLIKPPREPGLGRVFGVWRSRAEALQRGSAVQGSDEEEKAATAAGSTLARVQLALWGTSDPSPARRASARAELERLAGMHGLEGWLSLPETEAESSSGLSRREREVCMELANGYTAAETAQRLGISPRTVEKHAANAYKKLDITTRRELVQALGGGS